MADDEMTVTQAAEMLGIDTSAVRRAVSRGRIPARKIGPRMWLIKRDEVEAYRMTRHAGPPSGPKPKPTAEQP